MLSQQKITSPPEVKKKYSSNSAEDLRSRWTSFKSYVVEENPQFKRIILETNPSFSKGFITFHPTNEFVADHFAQQVDKLTALACEFYDSQVKILIEKSEIPEEGVPNDNPVAGSNEINKLNPDSSSQSDIPNYGVEKRELHEIEKALISIFNAKDITNKI